MKNMYPKGKVHPSPASTYAGGGGDALAVLKLLPAAILALTAALCYEDKEVLAYLITRSINGPAAILADAGEERRRCRRAAKGAHRPVFDCGCFDCYTSFWSRWDCSPERELIHQVIEGFEEQLAMSEKKTGRGRRKERREVENAGKKGKEKKERMKAGAVEAGVLAAEDKEVMKAPEEHELSPLLSRVESFSSEDDSIVVIAAEEVMEAAVVSAAEERIGAGEEQVAELELVAVAGERRSSWLELRELFNSRLWSLWSPAASFYP